MKEYTVIVVSFKWYSFFTLHVEADSCEEAIEKALHFSEGETGIVYETLDAFEGFSKSCHTENKPIHKLK